MDKDITIYKKYEKLIDSIDGIVWEADPDIHFTYVSKQAEKILGYPVIQWLNEKDFWQNHLYPDTRDQTMKYCRDQIRQRMPHDFEYRFVASDGTVKWLRDIVSMITDEKGNLTGIRGLIVDFTAQKKIQEELEYSVSALEATLEATVDAIIVMKLDGTVQKYNKKFLELWGIPADKENFKNAYDIVPFICGQLVDPDEFVENVNHCFSHPDANIVNIVRTKNGRYIERYSRPQTINGKVIGRISSFRDISDRIIYEQRRELMLQKETEARMAAEATAAQKEDFLSIASHELKTPLTPIRMQLRMIGKKLHDFIPEGDQEGEKLLKRFEDTDRQFKRFLTLVEQLLDVTRITAGRLQLDLEMTDLSRLGQDAALYLQDEFKSSGCEFHTEIEEGITALVDKTRIWQVFNNLLSNALKYGNHNPVSFILQRKENDGKKYAEIIVKDQGIGIAQEDQNKLFERFERIAPLKNYSGLGLGLFITKNIVTAHNGEIHVESTPGQGSTFQVLIPIE